MFDGQRDFNKRQIRNMYIVLWAGLGLIVLGTVMALCALNFIAGSR